MRTLTSQGNIQGGDSVFDGPKRIMGRRPMSERRNGSLRSQPSQGGARGLKIKQ